MHHRIQAVVCLLARFTMRIRSKKAKRIDFKSLQFGQENLCKVGTKKSVVDKEITTKRN